MIPEQVHQDTLPLHSEVPIFQLLFGDLLEIRHGQIIFVVHLSLSHIYWRTAELKLLSRYIDLVEPIQLHDELRFL